MIWGKNNLSANIYDIKLYQDGDKWKQKVIPIGVSKNESIEVIDLLFYKNHYALNEKYMCF